MSSSKKVLLALFFDDPSNNRLSIGLSPLLRRFPDLELTVPAAYHLSLANLGETSTRRLSPTLSRIVDRWHLRNVVYRNDAWSASQGVVLHGKERAYLILNLESSAAQKWSELVAALRAEVKPHTASPDAVLWAPQMPVGKFPLGKAPTNETRVEIDEVSLRPSAIKVLQRRDGKEGLVPFDVIYELKFLF